MHIFTFAEKDTTLYEVSGSMNSGLDEILEIRKDISDTGDSINVSRILIKFDLGEISQSIHNNIITNPRFFLNLYLFGWKILNFAKLLCFPFLFPLCLLGISF